MWQCIPCVKESSSSKCLKLFTPGEKQEAWVTLFSRVELDLQKRILNLSTVWMGMGVLLGEVVWEGLESELHPMSSWWRWPLVKNELQLSMSKLSVPLICFR